MNEAQPPLDASVIPAQVGWVLAERCEAVDTSAGFAGSWAWNRAAESVLGAKRLVHVAFRMPGDQVVGHVVLELARAGWRSGSPGRRCLKWPMAELGFGFRPRWQVEPPPAGWISALRRAFPRVRLELARCAADSVAGPPDPLVVVREGIGTWRSGPIADRETYLASLKGKHRRDLWKYHREILESGARWQDVEFADSRLIAACFALHRERLIAKGKRSTYFARRSESFFRALARQTSGGALRLSVLERAGRSLAACLAFAYRGRYEAYVSGWTQDCHRSDLGRQVLFHQILGEFGKGLREIDLLGGDLAYKREFGTAKTSTLDVIAVPSRAAAARERFVERVRAWRRRQRRPGHATDRIAATARKVVYVSATDELGGADASLFELVTCLDRARFAPEVVLPHEGPFAARYRQQGIPVHVVPLKKLKNTRDPLWHLAWLLRAPLRVLRLARLFARLKPAIVHVNTSVEVLAGLAACVVRSANGPRLVWHVRELGLRPRIVGAALRHLVRCWADAIVAISSPIAGSMAHKAGVYVIPNGVDLARFGAGRRGDSSALTVGWIGRVAPGKGLENFIATVKLVQKRLPLVRVLVVGAAHAEHSAYALSLQARARAELNNLEWQAGTPAVEAAYARMDVFVHLPDCVEGLGRTVLEAQAAGVPVVCWPKGGLVDAVRDGETGIFAPNGDPTGTAQAVIELVRHPERRIAMGSAGRRFAAGMFGREECARRVQATYEEVLA